MSQDLFWNLLAKKLAKEATPEELAQLEEMMRQHPEWLYSAQQIQDMWALPVKKNGPSGEAAFQQHLNKLEEKGVDTMAWKSELNKHAVIPFYRKKVFKWLAAASLIAFVSILFFKNFNRGAPSALTLNKPNEFSTHRGSKSKLKLPDGTVVWLNSGSKLTYDKNFGVGERHVELEGEAFFDVVKMHDLPFTIQTKVIHIKVLGTAFNVKSYADEPTTETSLVRGKVEITVNKMPEEKFILLPNNKLTVANAAVTSKADVLQRARKKIPLVTLQDLTYYERDSTVIVETSWKENKLVFQDESFAEIARKMERWYNVSIRFENAALEKERLTGSFTNETVIQALEALQFSTDFHFKMEQNTIIIK